MKYFYLRKVYWKILAYFAHLKHKKQCNHYVLKQLTT